MATKSSLQSVAKKKASRNKAAKTSARRPAPKTRARRTAVAFRPPPGAIAFPDSARYRACFGVRSESTNRLYKVAFDIAPGARYWVCSCPGAIAHGDCKHLRSVGLKGRRHGRQPVPTFLTKGGDTP